MNDAAPGTRGGVDLTPYVPRLVLDWQLEHPDDRWRQLEGSLLFVDLSGFTAMSERLSKLGRQGAEEVTEVVGGTFAELLAVAYAMGGGLLKFGGDALLLFFDGDGHASRAAHAGFEMRRTLRRVGQIRTSAGLVQLRMSMGIHTGWFDFFLVGESHSELLIAGSEATKVVDMEGAAGAGEIVVSEPTAEAIGRSFVGDVKGAGHLLVRSPSPIGLASLGTARSTADPDRFVSAAVRRYLEAGGDEPEHRTVTVAFIHFDGTDTLLAEKGPNEVADRLHRLVATVQAAADEVGVTFVSSDIDHDGGKLILAAGAPIATGTDDDAMLHVVRVIADADHGVPVRAGVHRGAVFAGDVGPTYRRSYTLMGDAVNTAARVMMRAEPGDVLVTDAVLARCSGNYERERLAPFAAKGKAKPLVANRLGALTSTASTTHDSLMPLFGRQAEVDALRETVGPAMGGLPSVIELVGDGGMGKTRLIRELRGLTASAEWAVAECQPYQQTTPYLPWSLLLRRALGIAADASPADIERTILATDPGLAAFLPLVGIVLGVSLAGTPEAVTVDDDSRRRRLHDVLVRLVAAVVNRPMVWVIEDAHWADSASMDAVAIIARKLSDTPLALVLTTRSDAGPLGEVHRKVVLAPLDAVAASALVRHAVPAPLMPHQVASIVDRAGGNPLYLQELTKTVVASGGSTDGLPDSVEAAIASRIDRLAPRERSALRHLSVLGARFDLATAMAVLPELAALDSFPTPPLREFVDVAEGVVRFRSPLLHEVAYGALSFRRRVATHLAVGDLLERSGREVDAAVLSYHFDRAGEHVRAWTYATESGRRATTAFARAEAIQLYRRALTAARHIANTEPAEVGKVWFALGQELWRTGVLPESLLAYARARRLLRDDPGLLAELCHYEGLVHLDQGAYSQALRWFRRGLRLLAAPSLDRSSGESQAVMLRLMIGCGAVRYRQGRQREAIKWCESTLAEAERVGDTIAMGHACDLLQTACHAARDVRAREYGLRAVELFEKAGAVQFLPGALNNLGNAYYVVGRWDEARSLYERSRDAHLEVGEELHAAVVSNNIADILANQGKAAEAASLYEEALATGVAAQHAFQHFFRSNLARVLARVGSVDVALTLLEEARTGMAALRVPQYVAQIDLRRAEILLQANRIDGAAEALLQADDLADGDIAEHRRVGAGIALSQGRLDDARALALESLAVSRQAQDRYQTALALDCVSAVHRRLGLDDAGIVEERDVIFAQLGVVDPPRLSEQFVLHAASLGVTVRAVDPATVG